MDDDDILDLSAFDKPEWTEALRNATLTDLYRINPKRDHVEASVLRIQYLCENLKQVFAGKDELIDFMAICTIAQLPLLMLGTWGTGKSMLVRKFVEGMGISPPSLSIDEEDAWIASARAATESTQLGDRRHFEYLVTRFTTPEEILGTPNVDLMLHRTNPIHVRSTRGMLPRAEIVFLDEVFKANSSILNALLTLMNERLYHNAGQRWDTNLMMLFGASNEPPQEDDLGAFYDRFPVRALCDPVHNDEASIRSLLERAHAQGFLSLAGREGDGAGLSPQVRAEMEQTVARVKPLKMSHHASVNDFLLLNRIAMLRFGGDRPFAGDEYGSPKDFEDCFVQAFQQLRQSYDISDRSFGHFYRLARARAVFEGRPGLTRDDCIVFQYAFKDPAAGRELPATVREIIGS